MVIQLKIRKFASEKSHFFRNIVRDALDLSDQDYIPSNGAVLKEAGSVSGGIPVIFRRNNIEYVSYRYVELNDSKIKEIIELANAERYQFSDRQIDAIVNLANTDGYPLKISHIMNDKSTNFRTIIKEALGLSSDQNVPTNEDFIVAVHQTPR